MNEQEQKVNVSQPGVTLPSEPLAIWSLVLGILSYLCFGPFTALPAVICGHLARTKIRNNPGQSQGSGMALAGLILGYIMLAGVVLLVMIAIIAAIVVPSLVQPVTY